MHKTAWLGSVAQLAEALDSKSRCSGFDSQQSHQPAARARVAEQVDAADLKSAGISSCTGSIPVSGTMMQAFPPIRAFLLDLDGTCYVGSRSLPNTLPFLDHLRERGIPYLFLTNNSSTTAAAYVQKLRARGFPVEDGQVLTCADASARHLLQETPWRRIYLVATEPVEEEFRRHGFKLTFENAEAVLLAFDTTITYRKMEEMAHLLQAGVPYYATSPDITCITERGLTPDVGVFIAGMKVMTGREPVILGKPSFYMVQAALERLGLSSAQGVAMVGDQLDTDITMGVTQGLVSVLVLTGETTLEKAEAFPLKPDFVASDLGEVLAWMRRGTI